MGDSPDLGWLVRASAADDQAAWRELVRRFTPRVQAVIRSYRLASADAEDVYQTVWLRLVEHIGGLREPESLPGWLRTTAQHECCHQLDRRRRTVPVDPHGGEAVSLPSDEDIEAAIVRAELRQALRDGLAELPERDQALLRAYAQAEPYKEIGELLSMKTGSIGPTLGRCLKRLRQTKALSAYLGTAPGAGEREGGDRIELARLD